MSDQPTPAHLATTLAIDHKHPKVRAFACHHAQGSSEREIAVAWTHAVRDGFRYDSCDMDLLAAGMCASAVLANGYGCCVPKATLLTAVARAAGIPARLGFADVRNHLSTARMRQTMKTDLFVWHGCTERWLDGAGRKATPVFNLGLCEKFGLLALDFDGVNDPICRSVRSGRQPAHGVRQQARCLRRPAAGAHRRRLREGLWPLAGG